MRELKAIIDTNVFISALIGKGRISRIYEAFADGEFTPVLSHRMLEELLEVINRPKLAKYFVAKEINRFKELLNIDILLAIPRQKINICRDSKDNIILEAATAEERADCIVSGDKDLLSLKTFRNISIISPAKFLKMLKM